MSDNKICIGEDFSGVEFFLDFNETDNVALYGACGTGKTRLMLSLLRQCVLNGIDVVVMSLDPEIDSFLFSFVVESGRKEEYKKVAIYGDDVTIDYKKPGKIILIQGSEYANNAEATDAFVSAFSEPFVNDGVKFPKETVLFVDEAIRFMTPKMAALIFNSKSMGLKTVTVFQRVEDCDFAINKDICDNLRKSAAVNVNAYIRLNDICDNLRKSVNVYMRLNDTGSINRILDSGYVVCGKTSRMFFHKTEKCDRKLVAEDIATLQRREFYLTDGNKVRKLKSLEIV